MVANASMLGWPSAVDEGFRGFPQGTPSQPLWLPDCTLHVKSTAGVLQSGGLVSRWQDTAGFGRHLIGVSGTQPTYTDNALNGRPCIRFDGSNDYMYGVREPTSGTIAVALVFVLLAASESTKGVWSLQNALTSTGPYLFCQRYNNTQLRYYFGSYQAAFNISVSTGYLHILQWTGSAWELYVNNDATRSYAIAQGTPANGLSLYLGNGYSGYSNIDVAEVWMFNRSLSSGDIAALKASANAEYALW